ncbi:MAG: hypothetical protein JWN69_584, partial [Alphaproteobacteria bacterium]|nr:hypothetical protein [Alphaproteobacteria bacterium]
SSSSPSAHAVAPAVLRLEGLIHRTSLS